MDNLHLNIFAIKRYALHDGPNIRTTVFLKGCPLRCHWCHNPEGIDFAVKMVAMADKCVGCGECIAACPENALQLTAQGICRDASRCRSCSICAERCPALAHEATGQTMSIDAVMAEIEKDLIFFDESGGGVTFSGGEPLCQPDGLLAVLQRCGALDIHRTVDTSGFASTEVFERIAPETDLFLLDIKQLDNTLHKKFTGVDNTLILTNLQKLAELGTPVRLRVPLIVGVNCDEQHLSGVGKLAQSNRAVQGVDLLPYHPSARAKYKKLDMTFNMNSGEACFSTPDQEQLNRSKALLEQYIADVTIGG